MAEKKCARNHPVPHRMEMEMDGDTIADLTECIIGTRIDIIFIEPVTGKRKIVSALIEEKK